MKKKFSKRISNFLSILICHDQNQTRLYSKVLIVSKEIELLAIIGMLPDGQIPFFSEFIKNYIQRIPNYISLIFTLSILIAFLVNGLVKYKKLQINTQILIIAAILKNYEEIFLIPNLIILYSGASENSADLIIILIGTILNEIAVFIQMYIYRIIDIISEKGRMYNLLDLSESMCLSLIIFLISLKQEETIVIFVFSFYSLAYIIKLIYNRSFYQSLEQNINLLSYGFIFCYYFSTLLQKQLGLNLIFILYTQLLFYPLFIFLLYQFDNFLSINTLRTGKSYLYIQQLLRETLKSTKDTEALLKLSLLFVFHKNHCTTPKCKCVNLSNMYSSPFIKQLIHRQKDLSEEYKLLLLIRLDYFNPYREQTQFQTQLKKIQSLRLNTKNYFYIIVAQYYQYYQRNQVEKDLFNQTDTPLFIKDLQKVKKHGERLQKDLIQLFKLQTKFWTDVSNDKIEDYQQLFEYISEILDKFDKIQQNAQKDITQLHGNIFSIKIQLIQAFLTQNLRQVSQCQSQINEIFQIEGSQSQKFTNFSFCSNQAIQIVSNASDGKRGIIENISTKNNLFFGLDKQIQFNNINMIIQKDFQKVHDFLLDNYYHLSKSKTIGKSVKTFYQIQDLIIHPIQIILLPTFDSNKNDNFSLVANILKLNEVQQIHIQLDKNFRMRGCDKQFIKFLQRQNINPLKLDLFMLFPQLKLNLIDLHQQYISKGIKEKLYLNQQMYNALADKKVLQLSTYMSTIKSTHKSKYNLYKFDPLYQLKELEGLFITEFTDQQDIIQSIDYEISIQIVDYIEQNIEKDFFHYQLQIFSNIKENEVLEPKSKLSPEQHEIQNKEKRKLLFFQSRQIEASVSATSSTVTIIRVSDELNQILHSSQNSKTVKIIRFLTPLVILQLIGLIILFYSIFDNKRKQQDVCFNRLIYGAGFLDAYARLTKGSRHTVYQRDLNKYLDRYQIYSFENQELNVTIENKLTISFFTYYNAGQDLKKLYQDQQQLLSEYQSYQIINFKFINYDATVVFNQVVENLASYYEMMNTLFYFAVSTFASDPSLYLKGTIDIFAQLNTRSILYINFDDVCQLTQNLVVTCIQNTATENNNYDNLVQMIFLICYFISITLYLIQCYYIQSLINVMKQHIALYLRVDLVDINQELESLKILQVQIKDEDYWLSNDILETLQSMLLDYNSKSMQSPRFSDTFRLPKLYAIWTIGTIFILMFILIFQLLYTNYAIQINPVVNSALKGLQIRLDFIELINNWDIQNTKSFYQAFANVYENDEYYYNQNIVGDLKIYQKLNVNLTQLDQKLLTLNQESFTGLITDETMKSKLLFEDICLIENCSMYSNSFMNQSLFKEELLPYFQVGLLKLYQETGQFILSEGYLELNSTNSQYVIEQFIKLMNSQSYFLYIYWGLEATNLQMKLFSTHFVNLAKQQLTNQTYIIQLVLLLLGSSFVALQIPYQYYFYKYVVKKYLQARNSISLIPIRVIINKNLIRQLKYIN